VPVRIVDASQQAFVYALKDGLRLGAAVALLGALLAWTLVGRRAESTRTVEHATAQAHSQTPEIAPL
jgi:hypothetical protein